MQTNMAGKLAIVLSTTGESWSRLGCPLCLRRVDLIWVTWTAFRKKEYFMEIFDLKSTKCRPYIKAIQDYIGGLNWAYKVELRDKTVKYINAYGYIQDANTVKTTNKRGKVIFFNSETCFK